MIRNIYVCSAGHSGSTLLDMLLGLQKIAPVDFEIVAVNLDQKQPGFPAHVLPEYLASRGVPFHIETRDTYSIVKRLIPEGQTTCSLCSRLRRGHLYRIASELGATKIALGHHRDDIVETLFLNLFYTGKLKAIPPKLRSKDGRHLVIRPLALVKEADLARYAELRAFPIIPCDLCGSQEGLQRIGVGLRAERDFARMLIACDPHLADVHPERLGQAHRLAVAGAEDLGRHAHGTPPDDVSTKK